MVSSMVVKLADWLPYCLSEWQAERLPGLGTDGIEGHPVALLLAGWVNGATDDRPTDRAEGSLPGTLTRWQVR